MTIGQNTHLEELQICGNELGGGDEFEVIGDRERTVDLRLVDGLAVASGTGSAFGSDCVRIEAPFPDAILGGGGSPVRTPIRTNDA